MVISGDQQRQGLFLSVNPVFSGSSEPFSQTPSLQVGEGMANELRKTSGVAPPSNVPGRICPVILNSADHRTESPFFLLIRGPSAQRRADSVEMSQMSSNLNL